MINLKHGELTHAIIAAAFEVHRGLGHGFLEKVYQRAMQAELQQRGLQVDAEFPIRVTYKGSDVGDYAADLFVERRVLVELKVAKEYNPKDEPQLLNELKATGVEVGLLINFGADKGRVQAIRLHRRVRIPPACRLAGPGGRSGK
jgi:GxxExxY protein